MRMRPQTTRAVAISAALAIGLGPLAACSTGRLSTAPQPERRPHRPIANTQVYKEVAGLRVYPREDATAEAHAALPAAAFVLAARIAIKLVQRLIEARAKQYEATTTASETFTMAGLSPANPPLQSAAMLHGRADFLFFRLIDDEHETSGLTILTTEVIAQIAKSADDAMGTTPHRLGPADIEATLRAAVDGKKRALTFCAVGRLIPRGSRESFEVQLLTYTFPALKARSAADLSLEPLEKREDRLVLSLSGPSGLPATVGNYAVGHTFPLRFDPALSGTYTFKPVDKVIRSRPIAVPSFRDFVLTATLAETSNFKQLLERLAKEVGSLDPSGWFSAD